MDRPETRDDSAAGMLKLITNLKDRRGTEVYLWALIDVVRDPALRRRAQQLLR